MASGTSRTHADELEEDGAVIAVTATQRFEQAVHAQPAPYALVLFVAGSTPYSIRAIRAIKQLCDEYLAGRCDLQIVDIYQQPALAEAEGVLAVPSLIKKQPEPVQMLVGDMTDLARVLRGLGLTSTKGDLEAG